MEALALSLALTIIEGLVKNPASAESLKTKLLAIRDGINTLYPNS